MMKPKIKLSSRMTGQHRRNKYRQSFKKKICQDQQQWQAH